MTLLRNVTAVTLNERREIVDDVAIKIDGTTISSIGSKELFLRMQNIPHVKMNWIAMDS